MITVNAPLTAFLAVVIKINGDLARMLRYRTGRTNTWQWTLLVVLWLWFVLSMMPGLRQFVIGY